MFANVNCIVDSWKTCRMLMYNHTNIYKYIFEFTFVCNTIVNYYMGLIKNIKK